MDDILTRSIPRSPWYGWGDPRDAHPLPDVGWAFLARELGVTRRTTPARPVPLEEVRLPEVTLPRPVRAALAGIVGQDGVRDDAPTRIEHAGGKKYPDLYRLWQGDASHAPDAVVFPDDARQVADVLALCSAERVAVVPFGGGTSVVGGVEALRGPFDSVISLDLRRLNRMSHIDVTSRVATFQAGMRGPDVETALRPHGLTLGHYPQSHQEATIGGYVATRSAGQASTGYGRIDEMVLGVEAATPAGMIRAGGRAPASAAGPRLLDLLVGSEGAYGVLTEATLRVAPYPAAKEYAAVLLPDFATATAALRVLAQEGGHANLPDVTRLSDPDETWMNLTLAGRGGAALLTYGRLRGQRDSCVALFVWEGADRAEVRRRRAACEAILRHVDAIRLPGSIARGWEAGRFSGPYLRDEMLGHGVLADTLETATTWDNLLHLHRAVRDAITGAFTAAGTPCLLQCHVSHVYAAGASLYFTFIAREADNPLTQWATVKEAASAAIVRAGGTITHHHSVGLDHRDHLADEIGPLGVRILAAVKHELDPVGVLNPGKLIPAPATPPGVAHD